MFMFFNATETVIDPISLYCKMGPNPVGLIVAVLNIVGRSLRNQGIKGKWLLAGRLAVVPKLRIFLSLLLLGSGR